MKILPIGHLVKTNPIQTQFLQRVKLMQSVYLQRIMEKNAAKGYEKTKPIQTQFLQRPKMNANVFVTKDYRKKDDFAVQKNKPNSNPNKACPERSRMGQFPKSQNEEKRLHPVNA